MLFIISAFLVIANADELENCKCPDGYVAAKNDNGLICNGIFLKAIMPCNLPHRPRCVCSPPVTAILSEHGGVWCYQARRGIEIKRWPCENTDEWDEFYAQNPEEAPQAPPPAAVPV